MYGIRIKIYIFFKFSKYGFYSVFKAELSTQLILLDFITSLIVKGKN